MADMVERVADAVRSALAGDAAGEDAWVGKGWETGHIKIDGDVDPVKIARAVIEAMREPTDAMVGRVEDAYDGLSPLTVQYVWSGMIDAALASK